MERLDLSREFINDGCVKHAVSCSLLVAVAACGQESTGTVNGHVRDASGLGVAGAEVTALATGTGLERKAPTGRDGSYALTSLPIGAYRITVTHPGFKKAVRNGVDSNMPDRTDPNSNPALS